MVAPFKKKKYFDSFNIYAVIIIVVVVHHFSKSQLFGDAFSIPSEGFNKSIFTAGRHW